MTMNFYRNVVKKCLDIVPEKLTERHHRNSATCAITTYRNMNRQHYDHIPGPAFPYTIPFIGLIFHFKPFGEYTSPTFTKLLEDLYMKYGKTVRQRAGRKWLIFLFDPADIQAVMHQHERLPLRPMSSLMQVYTSRKKISPSLAFQNGKEWSDLRKPAQRQMLCPGMISKYTQPLCSIADDFVIRLKRHGNINDVLTEVTRLTIENSGMFCFNRRMGCFVYEQHELMCDILTVIKCLGDSFDRIPWYRIYPDKFYLNFESAYDNIRESIQCYIREEMGVIDKKLQSRQNIGSYPDFLCSLAIDSRLSYEEISCLIIDLFIAGVDATANALSFLLYHLAKNTSKQEILLKEIQERCPDKLVTERTFQDMPYLKACIKESLRLVPPLRDGTRRVLDYDMVVSGYRVPKGNTLVFCNSVISKNKKYFLDPSSYIPERWLRTSSLRENIHPFSVLPFGFGPRNCVGKRLAELQMCICVVKLLQDFELKIPENSTKLSYTYTLFATPVSKLSINLIKRCQEQEHE